MTSWATVGILVFPWINPLAMGPAYSVISIIGALLAGALLLLVWQENRPQDMATAWLLAALLSVLIGLCQYFRVEQSFQPWMSLSAQGDAFANLRQRNQFATLTNIGMLTVLWWLTVHPLTSYRNWKWAGLCLAAIVLAVGNAASASRTGLVQLLVVAGFALYGRRKLQHGQLPVLLLALVIYAVAAIMLPRLAGYAPGGNNSIISRFQDTSLMCTSRLTLWRNMLDLISQRPLLGWGWGELGYAHFMTTYEGQRFCELLDNAHNLPLHLAVEFGLPLALLLCGAVMGWVWRFRPWREPNPTRQLAWGVLLLIGLHSLLEYPLWYGPFQLAVALCLVLLLGRSQTEAGLSVFGFARLRQWVATVLLGVVAYVAWDYYRISQIYLPVEQRSSIYREHTLEIIRGSWLFRNQVRFANFTLMTLTRDNAAEIYAMGHELLHFSPEPRVVEKLIESAILLGCDNEARFFMTRYRAAYPQAYERWQKEGRGK
ncbi:MAG: Wzy polymerase domain-containing protein [Pseudomonadota bacterium]|nr:Wzy polymerase domain-containing protein [Pseudomonadota bacterium]